MSVVKKVFTEGKVVTDLLKIPIIYLVLWHRPDVREEAIKYFRRYWPTLVITDCLTINFLEKICTCGSNSC